MSEDIEQMLLDDTLLNNILEEITHLKLLPKDYIKIANHLLDIAINKPTLPQNNGPKIPTEKLKLPIILDDLVIRKFNSKNDSDLLKEWTDTDLGREFLLSRIDDKEITLNDLLSDDQNIFAIIESPNKIPFGAMAYFHYDIINNKAELRKLIGNPDFKGKGLGKKATSAWISYGINNLNLRKIYIYTYYTNIRNVRINRELGFKLEGIFKEENLVKGESKDILRMALLNS